MFLVCQGCLLSRKLLKWIGYRWPSRQPHVIQDNISVVRLHIEKNVSNVQEANPKINKMAT